ncbi:hypothetical protein [Lonepinella sp. BR2919]
MFFEINRIIQHSPSVGFLSPLLSGYSHQANADKLKEIQHH